MALCRWRHRSAADCRWGPLLRFLLLGPSLEDEEEAEDVENYCEVEADGVAAAAGDVVAAAAAAVVENKGYRFHPVMAQMTTKWRVVVVVVVAKS